MNSPAAELQAELDRHGIDLRIDGEDLCYRPRSALTSELAQRIRALKPELLDVLRGCSFTPVEREQLRGAPPDLWAAVGAIKRCFDGAEVVKVRHPNLGERGGQQARGDAAVFAGKDGGHPLTLTVRRGSV